MKKVLEKIEGKGVIYMNKHEMIKQNLMGMSEVALLSVWKLCTDYKVCMGHCTDESCEEIGYMTEFNQATHEMTVTEVIRKLNNFNIADKFYKISQLGFITSDNSLYDLIGGVDAIGVMADLIEEYDIPISDTELEKCKKCP